MTMSFYEVSFLQTERRIAVGLAFITAHTLH
jgi:hypothetical protein